MFYGLVHGDEACHGGCVGWCGKEWQERSLWMVNGEGNQGGAGVIRESC